MRQKAIGGFGSGGFHSSLNRPVRPISSSPYVSPYLLRQADRK